MQVESSESRGNIQFIQSDSNQIGGIVDIVLRHLSAESRAAISESIENAIQQSNLRFVGLRSTAEPPSNIQADFSVSSTGEIPTDSWTGQGSAGFAAAFLQEYPGKLACLVGPTSLLGVSDQSDLAVDLVRTLVEIGWSWSVELVQVLFESDSPFSRFVVQKAGFRKVAKLIQMQLDWPSSSHFGSDSLPSASLKKDATESMDWRRYNENDRSLWIDWLDETYRETKDCPELNGLRSTESSLEGYLAASYLPVGIGRTSRTGPRRESHDELVPNWWGGFLNVGGKRSLIAGYLLNPTALGVWELTYMGVTPSARGRNFGQETLQRAVQSACELEAERLWLAVDERNTVARTLYERFGFAEARRLEAWIAAPPGKTLA